MDKPIDKLITDRTLEDIHQRTSKAFLNLGDLERVNAWLRYIAEELGVDITSLEFAFGERIRGDKFQKLLDNVTALLDNIYDGYAKEPPVVPLRVNWTYLKQNELERLAVFLSDFAYALKNDTLMSATFNSAVYPAFRYAQRKSTIGVRDITLVSLSGATKGYQQECGGFFRFPRYADIFPNDGFLMDWELPDGTLVIDTGSFAVPIEQGDAVKIYAR